ncbi:hypothetical protein B0G81_2072 [Paraburkholderia sp. BL6665CI2N2]|uniref:hypothetical protein n=1 Tax=Paraburkholderia sp. BL6665CI2N2 TaxID=1938806 RepID=UPI00106711E4|nr:hypothetical protein [Paraburkholderia sp. BL6665CI2N2]TDY21839.1 hypothetical protein B0G81_2072 [Paraburkholderia sp. BL6665CI2N2]
MKQSLITRAVMAAAGLLIAAPVAIAQSCHYNEVNPGTGKLSVGDLSIDLGQSDGTESPTAWLGPLTLSRAGGAPCSVDPNVSIVERPLYSNGKQLLVSTYSGSEQVVYAIDASTCKIQWKSDSFSGKVKLSGNRLQMDKRKVKLGSDCTP